MAHGALVLLPLLSLELPMLQAFWLLARGVGEGPASPFQPVWKGRIRRKALPVTMSGSPGGRRRWKKLQNEGLSTPGESPEINMILQLQIHRF